MYQQIINSFILTHTLEEFYYLLFEENQNP